MNRALYEQRLAELTDDDGDGYNDDEGDCDDELADVNPGADEECDGIDNNCDGTVDESGEIWFYDSDGDGFGDAAVAISSCNPDDAYVTNASDCDDLAVLIHPDAAEECDGIDNNCNGTIDEGLKKSVFFEDNDGDGFGDPKAEIWACEQPAETVLDASDCDDTDSTVSPNEKEICNDLLDNDCDGTDNGCGWAGTTSMSSISTKLVGVAEGDGAGLAVAVSDADGDSHPDLVIGAFSSNAAYYVDGNELPTEESSLALVDGTIIDDQFSGAYQFGQGVHFCDFDGDGAAETFINGYDPSGRSDVFGFLEPPTGELGITDSDFYISAATDYEWMGLYGDCGDFNDDGLVDLVLGAGPYSAGVGKTIILYGPASEHSPNIDLSHPAKNQQIVTGTEADGFAGAYFDHGDVNGDGVPDLFVAATDVDYGAEDAGGVFLLLGPFEDVVSFDDADAFFFGDDPGGRVGRVAVGDLDSDGTVDWAIAANLDDTTGTDAGAVWVTFGGSTLSKGNLNLRTTAEASILGASAGGLAGVGLAISGDFDRSGTPELLVSATKDDSGGASSGSVFVFNGNELAGGFVTTDAPFHLVGETINDQLGYAMVANQDVTADGFVDLVVGAYGESSSTLGAGAVYILDGRGQ